VATAARSDGGGFVVSAPLQNVEKVIHDLFNHAIRKMRFPDRAYFQ
jgi:hypothetical protein